MLRALFSTVLWWSLTVDMLVVANSKGIWLNIYEQIEEDILSIFYDHRVMNNRLSISDSHSRTDFSNFTILFRNYREKNLVYFT